MSWRRLPAAAIAALLLIAPMAAPQAPGPPGSTPRASPPTIACADSSDSGVLGDTPCTIFARRPVQLSGRSTMWTLETFPTRKAAQQAVTPAGAVIALEGKYWLFTVGPHRPAPTGATRVDEVGPLPLPSAASYEMILAYVAVPPGAKSAVHVQSGPEAWYVLGGSQCVETPDTVLHLDAEHPGFVPADTPMFLIATGTTTRRAFFVIVHDAARPFYTEIHSWTPRGRCSSTGAPRP